MLNSEYARQRILSAALDLFGKAGYAATTVRMIANQADVSLSAIPYYFESKENLYLQVVEKATEQFHEYFGELAEEANQLSHREKRNNEEIRSLVVKFCNHHIDYVMDPKNEQQLRLFFQMRSTQDAPHEKTDLLSETTVRPMANMLRLVRTELSQEEAVLLAYSLIGEQLFFFYHRYSILKQLGKTEYDQKTLDMLRSMLLNKLILVLDS